MAATYKVFLEKLGGTDATTHIGNIGEIFFDPQTTVLRKGDGSTPGGIQLGSGGNFVDTDTLATVTTRGSTTTNSITIGGATINGNTTVAGNIVPNANEQYDLGSATNRFRDLYLSTNTIKMGSNTIGFNGTSAANLVVNGEPINTVINNSTIVQNVINGSAWQLRGPYTNEGNAAAAGVQVGQAYYDNGGTVRVRLS